MITLKQEPIVPTKECNCRNWCRTWNETQGFKYPKSNHAPGCNLYHTERFVRVELDGSYLVATPSDAEGMQTQDGGIYTLTDVYLTRDQFDAMPEFEGF